MLKTNFKLESGVYTGQYVGYENILRIQTALKKIEIDSYITVGGLDIDSCNWSEKRLAKEIIRSFIKDYKF